jgi:CRP-like cAMP-binding protein
LNVSKIFYDLRRSRQRLNEEWLIEFVEHEEVSLGLKANKAMNNICCPIQPSCSFSFACNPVINRTCIFPGVRKRLSKGTAIWYNQDDDNHNDSLYIVCSGVMVCFRYSVSGDLNTYVLLGKGQSIGEMCLFTSYKIPFMVTALTDVEVCKISKNFIEQLIMADPGLSRNVFDAIIKNVMAIIQYVDMFQMKSAYDRIKRILCLLVESIGEGDREVNLTLTHKVLASLVHIDRVTVTKTLHKLEREGFVKTENRNLVVKVDYDSDEYHILRRESFLER